MFQKLKGQLFTAQPKFNTLENMFILPVNSLVQFKFQGSSLEDNLWKHEGHFSRIQQYFPTTSATKSALKNHRRSE